MLIAVKAPKHFIVAEFNQKIENAYIIAIDFALHQFMILGFEHTINELVSIGFECKEKNALIGTLGIQYSMESAHKPICAQTQLSLQEMHKYAPIL